MTVTRTRNGRMWARPRQVNGVTVPGDGVTIPPGPPTSSSAIPTTNAVTLTWANPARSTGTMIRRATGPTPPATPASGTLVVDAGTGDTAHTDSGLSASTQYSYSLWAHDAVPQYSSTAATHTVTTTSAVDAVAPGPVTNIALAGRGTDFIGFNWINPVDGDFAGVQIRRSAPAVPPAVPTAPTISTGTLVTDRPAPETAWIVGGLTPDRNYIFSLFARDEVPNWSARTTFAASTTPTVVTGVRPWWGWSAEHGDSQYNDVEGWVGEPGEVRRIFVTGFPANYTTALQPLQNAINAGRLPHWSCKAGTATQYRALGTVLNNMNATILVTWHHEPEDDTGAGKTFADPAAFRTAYNLFYDSIKLTCGPDVHVGPVLMRDDWVNQNKDPMDWLTAGKLDFLGVDGYNPVGKLSGQALFTPVVATAAELDVPVVIGEVSTHGYPPNEPPGTAPNLLPHPDATVYRWRWMQAFGLWLEQTPRIAVVQWYQSQGGVRAGDAGWEIEQALNPARIADNDAGTPTMFGTVVVEYETANQLGIHMAKARRPLFDATPPVLGPPTTFPNGTGDQSLAISNALEAVPSGGTYTLPRGIYNLASRVHPVNAAYRTCITVPNGRTFDFSQAELRLLPGQPRMTDGGVTTGQKFDIISNRYLNSTPATDITIIVGCLNGQGDQQGSDVQEAADECWGDGIALFSPLNCTVKGVAGSPWNTTVTRTRGDGQSVTYTTYGQIKNIRGWDGNGGKTETFHVDFLTSRGGNLCERLEFTSDDGAVHTATGGSSNGGIGVTYSDIWSHGSKSHGMTSWNTEQVTRIRVLSEHNTGSGLRNEYGYGHSDTDVISRNNLNNGLNLKGAELGTGPMYTSTRLTLVNNTEHGAQLNSIKGATFNGWVRIPAGKQQINLADNLYGSRASTGVVNNLVVTTVS